MTLTKLLARPLCFLAALAACGGSPVSRTETATTATVTATPAESADVHRFRIGALEAMALREGANPVPNDGTTFGLGQSVEAVAEVLAAAGLPTETLELSIQPLLVRDGERILLFDTGLGAVAGANAGRLPASLRAAGIAPSQVTDIFISHGHMDHVGGLVTSAGTPAFPEAAVHISAPEWAAMTENPKLASLTAVIAPKVTTFSPGAEIVPGVQAVPVEGHTPGHSAYEIRSGDERLLYIGDSAHHHVISVQRPDWGIRFDGDPVAAASRRALLQRAADEQLRLYAVHFPFPGVGSVRAEGESFVWVAE